MRGSAGIRGGWAICDAARVRVPVGGTQRGCGARERFKHRTQRGESTALRVLTALSSQVLMVMGIGYRLNR